jgi:putative transcriptional regulator
VDIPIFQGGPVDQDRLFYIHKLANLSNTKTLGNGLFWGGDLSELENALDTGTITQNEVRFFIGYAGWKKNQLEQECKDNAWLLVKNKYDIFSKSTELWSKILSDLGGSLAFYASSPSHPGLN